jgi:hypothetical protein
MRGSHPLRWPARRASTLRSLISTVRAPITLFAKARFSVGIGLESASPRMLKIMQKGNTPSKYLGAIKRLAIWLGASLPGWPTRLTESLVDGGRGVTLLGPRFRPQDLVCLTRDGDVVNERIIARASRS